MTTLLDRDLLDRLEARLRAAGSLIVDAWAPGLTDTQIDDLLQPLGIDLPEEARAWWRWHDGILVEANPRVTEISPRRPHLPLRYVAEQYAALGGAIGGRRVPGIVRELPTASGPVSETLRRRLADPALTLSLWVRTSLFLGIVFLMSNRPSWGGALAAMGVAVLLGVAGTIWLVRSLTHPLRVLASATHAVAGGDFSHEIAVTSSDEIGLLSTAFNRMVGDLRSGQELARAKQEAESKGFIFETSRDEIIAKAKKEGKLRVLTSLENEALKPVSEAFKKKYPFIDLEPQMATDERFFYLPQRIVHLTSVAATYLDYVSEPLRSYHRRLGSFSFDYRVDRNGGPMNYGSHLLERDAIRLG